VADWSVGNPYIDWTMTILSRVLCSTAWARRRSPKHCYATSCSRRASCVAMASYFFGSWCRSISPTQHGACWSRRYSILLSSSCDLHTKFDGSWLSSLPPGHLCPD